MIDAAAMQRMFGTITGIKYTLVEVALAATTPTPASATALDCDRGILVQAHPDNVGYVRVGGPETDGTHGILLEASGFAFVPSDQAQDVTYWTDTAGNRMNGWVI